MLAVVPTIASRDDAPLVDKTIDLPSSVIPRSLEIWNEVRDQCRLKVAFLEVFGNRNEIVQRKLHVAVEIVRSRFGEHADFGAGVGDRAVFHTVCVASQDRRQIKQ